jgi:hypothetical protein
MAEGEARMADCLHQASLREAFGKYDPRGVTDQNNRRATSTGRRC